MTTIRKAVITAAGRGTRMYPATNTVQKELFPLIDIDGYAKATLQIIVEEALGSGIEEICIVANPTNVEPLKQYFQGLTPAQKDTQFKGKEWALALSDKLADIQDRLTFVVQETQDGFGHAVYQASEWANGDSFVLLIGDHVYYADGPDRCTRKVINVAEKTGAAAVASVMRASEVDVPRYGTIAGKPLPEYGEGVYEIVEMVEKPSLEYARTNLRTPGLSDTEYLCFFGINIFPGQIFECLKYCMDNNIRVKGEIQLTSAMDLLFKQERFLVCEVNGEHYDMGVPEGLIRTQIALALHSPFADEARAQLAGGGH